MIDLRLQKNSIYILNWILDSHCSGAENWTIEINILIEIVKFHVPSAAQVEQQSEFPLNI